MPNIRRPLRRRGRRAEEQGPTTAESSEATSSAQAKHVPAYAQAQGGTPAVSLLGGPAQGKLRINEGRDRYEVEADEVAAQVASGSSEPTAISDEHPAESAGTEMAVQQKHGESTSTNGEGNALSNGPGGNSNNVSAARTEGQPLPASTRAQMESVLTQDFSQVRVHTDQQDTEAAAAIDAQAFTVGQDIVFGAGQYAPETMQGKQLLAHELTHVVQQSADRDAGNASAGETGSPAVVQRQSTGRRPPPARLTAAELLTTPLTGQGVRAEATVRGWLRGNRARFMFSTPVQVVAAVRSALSNESAPLSDEAIERMAREVGITFLPAAPTPAPARPPLSESGPQADTPAPDAGIEPSMAGTIVTAIASHRDVNRALQNAAPPIARQSIRDMERRGTGESLTRPPPEEERRHEK